MSEHHTEFHYLIHFGGEITVKGRRTRQSFVRRLEHNLRDALDTAVGADAYRLRRQWTRIFVASPQPDLAPLLARVIGVRAVSRAEARPWRDFDDLVAQGGEIFRDAVRGRTFAVRARRGEEATRIPFESPDIEREIGSRLLDVSAGVDLDAPEVEARVELHGRRAYFFHHRTEGTGGLPAGTEGRALVLLSGGFDSPVAAWRMMRRGLRLDYVFFNLAGDEHRDGVLEVAKILGDRWSWGYRPKLYLIDLREAAEELKAKTPGPLWQVLLKRRMLVLAAGLAQITKARGLVTGDALGQVSSQTLPNLAVVQSATELPVLRPLVGFDKDEIFADARRIGTYGASSKVAEYCGLTPDSGSRSSGGTATHSTLDEVLEAEAALDPELPSRLLDQRVTLDLRALDLDRARATSRAVEDLDALHDDTEGEIVWLDLRSRAAFDAWHPEGARHFPFPAVLDTFADELEPDADYVAYCEIGLKSAQLAETMAAAGYRARHVAGGFRKLLRWVEANHDPALRAALSPALLD